MQPAHPNNPGKLAAVISGLLWLTTASAAVTEQDVARLPLQGLQAIQQDGEVVFMSDNGRFVIKGELYDLWTRQRITDFQAMRHLANRLDLKAMKLDIAALNSVTLGHGSQTVVVFMSPHCSHGKALIQAAKLLTSSYRFQWVFISGNDPKIEQQIHHIVGAASAEQALDALMTNTTEQLPTVSSSDPQKTALTQLTAQLLAIEPLPFIIAPDGRFHHGPLKNLKAWLETTL